MLSKFQQKQMSALIHSLKQLISELELDYQDICASNQIEFKDEASFFEHLVSLYQKYKNNEVTLPKLLTVIFNKLELQQVNQDTTIITKKEDIPCKQEFEDKKPERFEFLKQHFKTPQVKSIDTLATKINGIQVQQIQRKLQSCKYQENKLLQLLQTLPFTRQPDKKQLQPPPCRPKKKNPLKLKLLEKQFEENLEQIHKSVVHKLKYLVKALKKQKQRVELTKVSLKVVKNVFLINKDQNQQERQLYEMMKKEIPVRQFNHRELKEHLYMGIYLQIGQSIKGNREMKSNSFLINQLQTITPSGRYEWHDATLKLIGRLKMYQMNKEEKFSLKEAMQLKVSLLKLILCSLAIEDYHLMKQVDDFLK